MGRFTTRITALFLCVLVAGGMTARADPVIPIIDTDDGSTLGTLNVTRSAGVAPGWDEIDLNFASWTPTQYGSPTYVAYVGGTWTGLDGSLGVSSLDGTDWVQQTANNSPTLLESYVNFDLTYNKKSFVRGDGSAGAVCVVWLRFDQRGARWPLA